MPPPGLVHELLGSPQATVTLHVSLECPCIETQACGTNLDYGRELHEGVGDDCP